MQQNLKSFWTHEIRVPVENLTTFPTNYTCDDPKLKGWSLAKKSNFHMGHETSQIPFPYHPWDDCVYGINS